MIQIKPIISSKHSCSCGSDFRFEELQWQGLHVCEKMVCPVCNKTMLCSLPVNQSGLEQYIYYPDSGLITDPDGKKVRGNWFTAKLESIARPVSNDVTINIEILRRFDQVLILNTLDYIYGHSLLFLLNLQRIIRYNKDLGIIVIIQPMLKWLIPKEDVSEIWTVNLGFKEFNNFYSALSDKINNELNRFQKVFLSKGHLIPTNENIEIEKFTGVEPFNFLKSKDKSRITFIWREDAGRLWIRNIYLLKGFKKMGIGKLLNPVQYLRVVFLFRLLKRKLGSEYTYSVSGLGKKYKFPSLISDKRVSSFDEESEKQLCRVYAESILVIGVHGSGMLLPSAHAGMTISLMPSKRWGNYEEDILYSEGDVRLATFQKRIVPLNLCIYDICDIVVDMVTGRDLFLKKFIHSEEL
jgi:hypothetical protein